MFSKSATFVSSILFSSSFLLSVQGSCDIQGIMGRTFIVPRGTSCYKLDLIADGLLYVDFNNIDCLNDSFTIDGEVSFFDDAASTDDKIVFKTGEARSDTWSGTVTLVESSLTGEEEDITVNNVSKDVSAKTFEAELILPLGCMAPSSEPSTMVSVPSFETKSELQAAVDVYCANPEGWNETSTYATYG